MVSGVFEWQRSRSTYLKSLTLVIQKSGQNGADVSKGFDKLLGWKQDEIKQINTLIYAMGDEADDILKSFQLTATQKKKYDVIKERFENYFVVKRNVIFERVKFNRRIQAEGETVDTFVTALYFLCQILWVWYPSGRNGVRTSWG